MPKVITKKEAPATATRTSSKLVKNAPKLSIPSWAKAKERDPQRGAFEDLEAGVYVMAVTDAVMDNYGPKKRLGIRWEYTVQEGDAAGCIQSDFSFLDTEDDAYYTQVRISSMGFDIPETPEDLASFLEDLKKDRPIVRARVVHKDGFVHVYVNKLIDEAGGETRNEILGKDNKSSKPATQASSASSSPEKKATVTKESTVNKPAEGGEFEAGDRVQFVEGGETLHGKFVEYCAEEGFVAIEVDDVNETWEVSVEENGVVAEEEEPKEAPKPAAKKLTKKVVKKLDVGTAVTFSDGESDCEGEIVAVNAKSKTFDVQVGDDVYEVGQDDVKAV